MRNFMRNSTRNSIMKDYRGICAHNFLIGSVLLGATKVEIFTYGTIVHFLGVPLAWFNPVNYGYAVFCHWVWYIMLAVFNIVCLSTMNDNPSYVCAYTATLVGFFIHSYWICMDKKLFVGEDY